MTAGLIIIGDEILKGKTSDSNSLYAARRLRESGAWRVRPPFVPSFLPTFVSLRTHGVTCP